MRKITISLIIIMLIGLGAWLLYDQTHLRITSETPKPGGTASTGQDIIIAFNHKLDPASVNNIDIKPYVDGSASVSDNKLIFHPKTTFKYDSDYEFDVPSVRSTGGLTIDNFSLKFHVGYIPFNQQTKEQQQSGINNTDKFQSEHRLAATLPYTTSDYQIGYTVATDNTITYTITLYAITNGPQDQARYTQQLKAFKAEALDYIRKYEDPSKLKINYEPASAASL